MSVVIESTANNMAESVSDTESAGEQTNFLSQEEKRAKEEAREAKRISSIKSSFEKYSDFNDFEFKTSKIRDTIYNLILNSSTEQTKNDLFTLRRIKNLEEYEKSRKLRKEFQKEHPKDTYPGEVVKPDYEYLFNEMTDSTKTSIKNATSKSKKDKKNKFAREKIRHWKNTDKALHNKYSEHRKESLKKDPSASLEQIVLGFDSKFFDDFVFDIKITKGKGENKVEEVYRLPKDMPPALRFKHYLSILTRNNFRCSKDAQNYIAIFVELVIRQVIFTGLININGESRAKLDVSEIHTIQDASLADKFAFLEKFISFSETYISRPTEKAKTTKTRAPKGESKKKKKEKKPLEEMSLQEKINNKFDYPHFLAKQAGEYCKVTLAKEWKQDEKSDLFKITLTKPFKEFCYSLMTEIVHKIGLILKSEISSRRIKTISTSTVVMAITHLLISTNVSEANIEKTISFIETTYKPYVEKKKKKKSAKKDDDEDEV